MNIVIRAAFVVGQVLGVAAVLLGVLVLWGPGWALLVGGLFIVGGFTAFEALALGRPVARSDRRGGATAVEVR